MLIGVRICGWAAEFLFNQSLLPFIYGALPQAEEQRGRLFIEGPVTALTNGAVGIFLIGYFWAFAEADSESYGFRLDLLYFIGIIAAAVMWFWSKKMIPELSRNLLRRIGAGGSVNAHFQHEMQVGGSQFAGLLQQVGTSAGSVTQQVQTLLNAFAPTESAPRLLMLLQGLAPDDPARAEVWQALLRLKALPELQQAWSDLVQQPELPVHTELQAAVSAMRTIGRSDLIQIQLSPWLQVAQQECLAVLLHEVQYLGLDASIQLAETLRTRLENNDFADASLLHLAAALGGDRFYPAIAQRLRQVDEADLAWEQLGELQFASHQLAFDAFGLLLGRAEAVSHPAYAGLTALIRAYPWLVWPLVWLLILPGAALPAELRAQRHLWPGLLQQSDPWRWADLVLFRAMLQDHPQLPTELQALDWATCDAAALRQLLGCADDLNVLDADALLLLILNLETVLAEPAVCIALLTALESPVWQADLARVQQHATDTWRLNGALAKVFAGQVPIAHDWLRRRQAQWLQADLLLLMIHFPAVKSALQAVRLTDLVQALLEHDPVAKDKMLTTLEQSGLPREIFTQLRDALQALQAGTEIELSYWPSGLAYPNSAEGIAALWPEAVARQLPDATLRELYITDDSGVYPDA